MPFKLGPNNTLREYDSRTGRYCKSSHSFHQKRKHTSSEKEEIRRTTIYNIAKKSKDKYLFSLYCELEKLSPGCVKHVNSKVFDKNIEGKQREIDIITDKTVFEVKSGPCRHKEKQFIAQQNFAKARNKEYIVYAPDVTDKFIKDKKKKGITVIRSLNEYIMEDK